jgi:hypothetical protein
MQRWASQRENTRPRLITLSLTCGVAPLALLTILGIGLTWAQETSHNSVTMLWNLQDGSDCESIAMELVGNYFWSCTAAIPGPDERIDGLRLYFKFMIDGNLAPLHYGKDIDREYGVVLGMDPPAIVSQLASAGYFTFTLDEAGMVYSLTGASGSIHAIITHENVPEPIPIYVLEGTKVTVHDIDWGVDLGTFFYDLGQQEIPITHLLPGHDYLLRFSAPGWQELEMTEYLPGTDPHVIEVTLAKLVAQSGVTWGEIKSQYR